jgi:hypothetical protein
MLKVALSFSREEQELSEQGDDFAVDFETDTEPIGTTTLDNLVPSFKDKALFASQGSVGKQAASCLARYWQELTTERASFRSDVKDIRARATTPCCANNSPTPSWRAGATASRA